MQHSRMQSNGASALDRLRNSQSGQYIFPIEPQFSHWSEEVQAWRNSAALLNQSLHMTDLYVQGPDVIRLLSDLSVNSYANFGRNKAKQIICCNEDGYLIGDSVLFGLEDDLVKIVGRPCVPNWVQFHAETGNYDVTVERDERRVDAPDAPRKTYRFEVQGPRAIEILNEVNEGGTLTTKFFNMGEITIAGCAARTLSHGMGGAEGLEIWGPADDGPRVRARLMEAGEKYGMRPAGARAYSTSAAESGWMPSPLPAIYTGDPMQAYRDWLPETAFEYVASVGGSFLSEKIEDYYLTPWDLDYQRVIRFDHDFIGRSALEAMQDQPHRKKVTLVWDHDSVLDVIGGQLGADGLPPKMMEWPSAYYATHQYDAVLSGGAQAGLSFNVCYSANERAWISLASVAPDLAEPGTKVSVLWGEEDGGTRKPHVERHRQVEVTATVAPWPIHKHSRENYRNQR